MHTLAQSLTQTHEPHNGERAYDEKYPQNTQMSVYGMEYCVEFGGGAGGFECIMFG